jgi:hypothetical protein
MHRLVPLSKQSDKISSNSSDTFAISSSLPLQEPIIERSVRKPRSKLDETLTKASLDTQVPAILPGKRAISTVLSGTVILTPIDGFKDGFHVLK